MLQSSTLDPAMVRLSGWICKSVSPLLAEFSEIISLVRRDWSKVKDDDRSAGGHTIAQITLTTLGRGSSSMPCQNPPVACVVQWHCALCQLPKWGVICRLSCICHIYNLNNGRYLSGVWLNTLNDSFIHSFKMWLARDSLVGGPALTTPQDRKQVWGLVAWGLQMTENREINHHKLCCILRRKQDRESVRQKRRDLCEIRWSMPPIKMFAL